VLGAEQIGPLQAQLTRARELARTPRASGARGDAGVGVDEALDRVANLRLPDPVDGALVMTRWLGGGRLRLPAELDELCGLRAWAEVVVAPAGAQLLVRRADGEQAAIGRRHRIDRLGRLQLRQGQRRILGVGEDALVLLLANTDSPLLRIIEPTRILGLFASCLPVESEVTDDERPRGARSQQSIVPMVESDT